MFNVYVKTTIMLYCLLYLCCPRMYHDLFVSEHRIVDRFCHLPRDEFEDLYADKPVLEDVEL